MKIVIRADGSEEIGMGHVMRCLALAEGCLGSGGEVIFVGNIGSDRLPMALQSSEIKIIPPKSEPGSDDDAQQTAALARDWGAHWVLIDGYHFGENFQKRIKNANLKLLAIDDYGHAGHYEADLVLNQNLDAAESIYSDRQTDCQLLLGLRYALMRHEFFAWSDWRRDNPNVARRLLITLGGGDAENVSRKVIQAVSELIDEGLETKVVVGHGSRHADTLESRIQDSKANFTLLRGVNNMAELMAWADVSVGAAGSTSWERAFMGLPSLVIVLADNQLPLAKALAREEVSIDLGWSHKLSVADIAEPLAKLIGSKQHRQTMSDRGRRLIDGRGVARVLNQMRGDLIHFRRATNDDCPMYWKWANEPEVREASFCNAPIPWETHVRWFSNRLDDPNSYMYVGLDECNRTIGQVRFEASDGEADISVSVDSQHRGVGYGTALIDRAINRLFDESFIRSVHAYIKPSNSSSAKSFASAGFLLVGKGRADDSEALHYLRNDTHDH